MVAETRPGTCQNRIAAQKTISNLQAGHGTHTKELRIRLTVQLPTVFAKADQPTNLQSTTIPR